MSGFRYTVENENEPSLYILFDKQETTLTNMTPGKQKTSATSLTEVFFRPTTV